jgi:hypothetical protein
MLNDCKKKKKIRRHHTQCCGSWALVFMGTCNRLPDLNQDAIRNQTGGGFKRFLGLEIGNILKIL